MSQLQSIEPIQSAHTLHVHTPSVPKQQHVDAAIAEPWPCLNKLMHRNCSASWLGRRLRYLV